MNPNAWTLSADGSPGEALTACLHAATAAPSIFNTQPWRFRIRRGRIEVFADHSRRMDAIDPHGRELMISVGAAVLNLRVAVLAHGRLPVLMLLPDPRDPDLVARVTPGPARRPDATVLALTEAIDRRRTNRRPFLNAPIADEVMTELATAAFVEGASLAVADAIGRDAILGLIRTADTWLGADPRYTASLAQWTQPVDGRRDGVPRHTFGPYSALEALPLRDFGLALPDVPRRLATFEPHPTIAVIYTTGDGPEQWLRAGQALERVLLTATVRGLSSTPMTQPLEIPELRDLLADGGDGRRAQVILRLGYGRPCAASPRRPLSEVLMREPVPA